MVEPTEAQRARLTEAVIAKATRVLLLGEAPLGSWGDQDVIAPVRPDHQIAELLYGLRYRALEVDLTSLATADDVIRRGLQTDPAGFPADKRTDVENALLAACDWVAEALTGFGVA